MTTLKPGRTAASLRVASRLAFGLLLAGAARAADTPAPATAAAPAAPTDKKSSDSDVDTVQLNAFEVRADADNSYGALESTSITRFRTDLTKLPITAEVFTDAFMRDVAATSVEDMLLQYGGAGMGTADAGSAGSFSTQPGDSTGGAQINIRGLRAVVHRDGFLSSTPAINGVVGATESFSIERAEVTRGANSLLYGDVAGGAVVNLVSKRAQFRRNSARIDFSVDQYGSKRTVFDLNAGTRRVAVRVALLDSFIRYNRINLGGSVDGAYAQVAFRLPLNSTLRVWGQKVQSNLNSSVSNGNVNNFFYTKDSKGNLVSDTTDPRRNLNLRYLVATNQLGPISDAHPTDLNTIFTPGFNLANVDSFRGWFKSTWAWDAYSGTTLESQLNRWLSSQITLAYDDAVKDGPGGTSSLTPGNIFPNSGTNPFSGTAISDTPSDSLTHTRRFGWRGSLLADNQFFHGVLHSQTVFSAEAGNANGGQSGVAYGYYLSDANGNIIVDPTKLANKEEGRTLLTNASPSMWYSVQNGLVAKPLFKPQTPVIQAINPATGQMAYWARSQRRIINLSLRSPTNPLGIVDNTGAASNGAQYNVGHTETHAYSLANVGDWWGGKIETLAGIRYLLETDANYGPSSSTIPPPVRKSLYTAGASYQLLSWLRPFADVATSYQPGPQPFDPYGVPRRSPSGGSLQPDFGFKFWTPSRSLYGTLTWAPENTIKDEGIAIDGNYVTAINPKGINGQYQVGGAPNSQINADKRSGSIELQLDYHHGQNFRSRLSFAETDGKILTTASFKQLYNDEFYVNNGAVTYADGTALLVDPAGKTGPATTPLTLAMINTPSNPFYASPDPDSGSITNNTLKTVLTKQDPTHGTAATGRNGLPISAIQYAWGDPNGHNGVMMPVVAGQSTTGYYHYSVAMTNMYDFTSGRLKGVSVGNTFTGGYQFRSHYYPDYNAGGTTSTKIFDLQRKLYVRPTTVQFDLILKYHRKLFGRYEWTTQLNVRNLFNHYELVFPPQVSGSPIVNNFIYTASPRQWIWSNSIAF